MAKNSATAPTAGEVKDTPDPGPIETPPVEGVAPPVEGDTSSSTRVKYAGSTTHSRELSNNDFKSLGMDGVGKQVWSPDNNHTIDFAEVDNGPAIIEMLTTSDVFAGEFKLLKPGQS